MVAKLGGREPKSHVVGPRIVFDLPLFVVTHQTMLEKGSKRTYHDGQRLYRLSDATSSHGTTITEQDFSRYKKYLSEMGCKKITARQVKTYLPRFCPKCLLEGHPNMRPYLKVKSNRNKKDSDPFNLAQNDEKIKNVKYEVYYSHSKPLLHQCHIGYWTNSGYELAMGIDIKRMSTSYVVQQNGGFMDFDLPDKKMKRCKTLT